MTERIIGKYCVVRTFSAGVFAGIVAQMDGKQCYMVDTRRIWYWEGACSLSQMALEGVKKPEKCKFSVPTEILLTECIEYIPCTKNAEKSIRDTPLWAV